MSRLRLSNRVDAILLVDGESPPTYDRRMPSSAHRSQHVACAKAPKSRSPKSRSPKSRGAARKGAVIFARAALLGAAVVLTTAAPVKAQQGVASGDSTASADGPSTEGSPAYSERSYTEDQRARARAKYAEGQERYREGRYEEAEAAFVEAYRIVPNPVVLLGVAEVRERRDNIPGAAKALERYLAERTDAPDRDAVEQRLAKLKSAPSVIAVESTPPGASVVLDGQPTDKVTPAEFEVSAGSHTVVIKLEGHQPATAEVQALFGRRHAVRATLEARAPAPATVPAHGEQPGGEAGPEAEKSTSTGPGAAVWATSGIAAAALITGTVLGFLALSEESDFGDAPTESSADRGERLALFADVSFGLAAGAAITAVVLFLSSSKPNQDARAARRRTNVAPTVHARGGGVGAHVSF